MMKANSIASLSLPDLRKVEADAVIVASGYESRSSSFASQVSASLGKRTANKFAWGFKEYSSEAVRLHNDEILRDLGYKIEVIEGTDNRRVEAWAEAFLRENGSPFTLVVDISSMTRTWYGALTKALSRASREGGFRTIFAYKPARWKKNSGKALPNELLGPVPGFSSHTLPNKPIALIIGLGSESERALGLRDHLDPDKTICFYTNPSANGLFERDVTRNNHELLQTLDKQQKYTYDLFDPFGSFKTLESVCLGCKDDYRVVLASLGPKIFGLYCFLIAVNDPDISVWRASPASKRAPVDEEADNEVVLVDVCWRQAIPTSELA